MPIVDIQVVSKAEQAVLGITAKNLAEAIAEALNASPGRVWVRLELLPQEAYAENGAGQQVFPVFVKVLHADMPPHEALVAQAAALAKAVASCVGRSPEHVHIEYAPPGRGRVAFGGELLQ
jgi:phenylpyruvate tautomerase PptA (4-oxalocrotonate tautomerase family)